MCEKGQCICLPGFSGPDCSQGRPAFVPMPQHVAGRPTKDPLTGLVSPASDDSEDASTRNGTPLSPDEQALADSDQTDPETADPSCDLDTCSQVCTFGGACTTKVTCTCFDKWHEGPAGAADVSPPNQDEGVSRSENTGLRKPLRNGQRNALAQVFRAVGAFGGRLPIGDPCTLTTNDERSTERENGWLHLKVLQLSLAMPLAS